MRLSIRTKLLLTFLGAAVLAILLTALGVGTGMFLLLHSKGFDDAATVSMMFRSGQLGDQVARAVEAGGDAEAIRRAAAPADLPPGVRVRVIDLKGRYWVDTAGGEGRTATTEEILQLFSSLGQAPAEPLTLPDDIVVNGRPWGLYMITIPGASLSGLQFGADSAASPAMAAIFIGGPVLALLTSLLLFWVFGQSMVRPLRHLSAVVGQIAGGDLTARTHLPQRGDELGQLARDVDAMARSLAEAHDREAASENARRYLVAAASHDLRTPLTALLAHAEAVRTGISENPEESLAVIQEKGLQLKRLIDDLFELAALDATQQKWQLIRTDVAELVRRSVVAALPELELEGIAVEAEIPEGALWANLAPGKLERVVDNLIANARKYGGSGKWLGVRVVGLEGRIRLEIADRGPGLSAEEQARVFERFYRSDSARSGVRGGSGLGLAIAREVLARQGGSIGVESPPEGGALFWVEIHREE